ncbi:MAG: hypothetical protein Q8N21_01340 [bacterium]|nr:hypothetical protein [bacterium]
MNHIEMPIWNKMNHNKPYKKKFYKKFSIGYNGKRNFFNEIIIPFRNYISSVYAVPPFSSGISNARWALNVSAKKLLELRMKLKEEKIKFNLIYNFDGIACPDDSFINKLLLITDFFKPDIVTFSNTFVLDAFIKNTNYKLNISVIHDINTINQLEMLIENDKDKQITSYNIGRRKTYNLQYIKSIREKYPDLNLKLMVNEGCIFECPDQIFHSCSLTISRGNIQNAEK